MKRKKQFDIRKYWWALPFLILGISVAAAWFIIASPKAADSKNPPNCASSAPDQFKCWQSRYEIMVDKNTPKEALTDVRKAYDTIPYVKSNCHQIAHVIGRAAGKKYGDVGRAYQQGDDFCWSGYYHGVMETIAKQFGADKIMAQLPTICDGVKQQNQYTFAHYNCVHGLGHGLMAVENNELFDSLKGCDNFNDSWERQSCQGGVYMENVMSEFNPGTKSKYIKDDDPLYPCTAVEDSYKEQCYLMQTSHALVVLGRDYDKVFELCAGVQQPFNATCWQSLGRDISGNSSSDPTFTKEHCEKGPTYEAQLNCITGAVKDFISYFHSDQQGLALCDSLSNPSIQASCIQITKEYYATF